MMATRAPACAQASEIARPMPRFPPVTIMHLPDHDKYAKVSLPLEEPHWRQPYLQSLWRNPCPLEELVPCD